MISWFKRLFKKSSPEVKKEPGLKEPVHKFKEVKKKVKIPVHSCRIVIQENNYEHEHTVKSHPYQAFSDRICLFTGKYLTDYDPYKKSDYVRTITAYPGTLDLSPYKLVHDTNFYTFKLQDYTLTLPKEAIKKVMIFNPVPCGEEEVEITEIEPV